jgi:DNA-binding GntR family transcriptional regulator
MPANKTVMNNVNRAYTLLRDKSVRFEFKPGERLNEVELARDLGMSRAPVREAMNRLVTEGLLSVVPNQGFYCRKLSASEITALYAVRADLEVGGIHEAARSNDRSALQAIARSCEKDIAQADALPVDSLVGRDEEFHLKVAALGGNSERVRLLEHINARIQFVRRINLENEDRRRNGFPEHLQMVQLLLAGDIQVAADLVRRHLVLNADQAMEAIRQGLVRIYAGSVA